MSYERLEKNDLIDFKSIVQENEIIKLELDNVKNVYNDNSQKPCFNYCSLGIIDKNFNVVALLEGIEEFKEVFFGELEHILKRRLNISRVLMDYKLGLICGIWRFFLFNPIIYAKNAGKTKLNKKINDEKYGFKNLEKNVEQYFETFIEFANKENQSISYQLMQVDSVDLCKLGLSYLIKDQVFIYPHENFEVKFTKLFISNRLLPFKIDDDEVFLYFTTGNSSIAFLSGRKSLPSIKNFMILGPKKTKNIRLKMMPAEEGKNTDSEITLNCYYLNNSEELCMKVSNLIEQEFNDNRGIFFNILKLLWTLDNKYSFLIMGCSKDKFLKFLKNKASDISMFAILISKS